MEPSRLGDMVRRMIGGEVLIGEPLARHVTLRVGGPADVLAFPRDEEEAIGLLRLAREQGVPVHVLGNGSNVFAPDEGVRGLVLNLTRGTDWVRFRGAEVEVGAGHPLPRLVQEAARRGLSGLEALGGVPGSVGGALYMNGGAAGQSIGDVTDEVRAATLAGQRIVLSRDEMEFGYRSSRLQAGDLVVLSARLRLRPGRREDVEAALREFSRRRRLTQPLELPNAGSIFKNPPGDYAGRLIEAAGCKGLRRGDAQVSPRHANFIVNLGNATARDVLCLMAEVRRRVRARSGVALEPEVRLLGVPQEELIRRLEDECPGKR